jgi:hypothetical protein
MQRLRPAIIFSPVWQKLLTEIGAAQR